MQGTYAGLPDFSGYNTPKRGKNVPNYHIFTRWPQNISTGRKLFQMAIKYNNISKALQNLPKLNFFGLKISGNPVHM
jgi:hypothetical protein